MSENADARPFALEHFWKMFSLLALGLCFWTVQAGRESLTSLQSTGLFQGQIHAAGDNPSSYMIGDKIFQVVPNQTEEATVHLKTGTFARGYLDEANGGGVILRTVFLGEGKTRTVFVPWDNVSHITVTNRQEK